MVYFETKNITKTRLRGNALKANIKSLIGILITVLILIGVFLYIYIPNKVKSEMSHTVPIVFIHGYKGTANSFHTMLERFEENGWGQKGLIYHVSPNGKVRDYPVAINQVNQTFVQIILENNRASFAESTEWLAEALRHLKEKYHVEHIHLVGHSMGGIISVKYMQNYQTPEYPNVKRFIALGSPFDGIYSPEYFQKNHDPAAMDLKPDSLAYQLLHDSKIPSSVDVLNIGSTGDLVALPESVKAIRKMVLEEQLTEKIIEDDDLGHSDLHESILVDEMIHTFLWQDEVQ